MLDLSHNHIVKLSATALHCGSTDLWSLDLSHNNMTVIEGAFPRTLRNLALRGNLLGVLKPATLGVYDVRDLEGKPQPPNSHIRNLFLDQNHIWRVYAQVFEALPHLENVWFGGNKLNCSDVRPHLPRGAACIDDAAASSTDIGSHLSSRFDPTPPAVAFTVGAAMTDFEGPRPLRCLRAGVGKAE